MALMKWHAGSVDGEDPYLVEGLHYEFYCKRRMLMPYDEMAKTILDGGETVYAKVGRDAATRLGRG